MLVSDYCWLVDGFARTTFSLIPIDAGIPFPNTRRLLPYLSLFLPAIESHGAHHSCFPRTNSSAPPQSGTIDGHFDWRASNKTPDIYSVNRQQNSFFHSRPFRPVRFSFPCFLFLMSCPCMIGPSPVPAVYPPDYCDIDTIPFPMLASYCNLVYQHLSRIRRCTSYPLNIQQNSSGQSSIVITPA